MSILEVNNVSKSFGGVKANVDISMSVDKGKIVGLIGPNGSGKTTTAKIALGLYKNIQGKVDKFTKKIGYVPQSANLIAGSLKENITLNSKKFNNKLYKDVPLGLTTRDSRSTFLINRELLTRFKVAVNPDRKFVLSSYIERGDNNDEDNREPE